MHSSVEKVFCIYLFWVQDGFEWAWITGGWVGGIQRRTKVCLLSDLVYCIYPQMLWNSARETVLPGRWGLKQCCLLLKRSVRKENSLEENGGVSYLWQETAACPLQIIQLDIFGCGAFQPSLSALSQWHSDTHPHLSFILSAVPSFRGSTVLSNQRW